MLENFKTCRQSLKLTQKALGEALNVAESTVRGWEKEYDFISLNKLVEFCNKYKFTIDYVVGFRKTNTNFKTIPLLDKKRIGKSLRTLRTSLHLTQQDLADECNVARSTITRYEIGINLITALNLYTICKNHKISMDKFLSM